MLMIFFFRNIENTTRILHLYHVYYQLSDYVSNIYWSARVASFIKEVNSSLAKPHWFSMGV